MPRLSDLTPLFIVTRIIEDTEKKKLLVADKAFVKEVTQALLHHLQHKPQSRDFSQILLRTMKVLQTTSLDHLGYMRGYLAKEGNNSWTICARELEVPIPPNPVRAYTY